MATIPPSPPTPELDALDKALLLAKAFSDHEIASINRNYDRFIAMITKLGVVGLAILTFFGWRTLSEVKDQVRTSVKEQVKPLVEQEVAAQFDKNNVQRTVEQILTREVRQDLDEMVRERAEPIVTAEMKRQRSVIERLVADRTKQQVASMASQISDIAAIESKHIVEERLAPRTLTSEQTAALVKASAPYVSKHYIVRVRPASGDPEQANYASELAAGLQKAGWKTILDRAVMVETAGQSGLTIVLDDTSHPPEGTKELEHVFDLLGMHVGVERGFNAGYSGPEGTKSVPALVIGYKP